MWLGQRDFTVTGSIMWSLSMNDVEHPSFALKAAVAANVLAPPSLTLEQVLSLQEAEIAEYSKPEFQNELYAALETTPEESAHVRQQLCLQVQVPIVGRLGFEPTALGVSQATLAILQYHGEAQAAPEMNKFHCHEAVCASRDMAVAAVLARRSASKNDQDPYNYLVSSKSVNSIRSLSMSPKSSRSGEGPALFGADEVKSQAVSTVSKRLADFKEEEPIKPKIVERTDFESAVGIFIALNSIVMGLEADAAEKRAVGWVIVENFFCLLWITEMLLKLWAFRLAYFRSGWNVFDCSLVLLNIFETWVIPSLAIEDLDAIGVLRIVRVLRILRLLRLIRLMKLFKNLWLIIVGFRESLSTLFWVLMLLSVVVYVFAIFLRLTLSCSEQHPRWLDSWSPWCDVDGVYVASECDWRGSGPLKSPLPTKLLLRWEDIQADHLDVPAEICKDLKLCECAQFEERKRCKEDNQLRLGMCV
eukprot:s7787_g1.t1